MPLISRGKFSPGSARQVFKSVKSVTRLGSLAGVVDQWANCFGGDSEIPSNLVLRKISPKIWLPALTVMWGIVTMCLGFVKNYAGFMVVRAILGITEGGLLPGIVSSEHKALGYTQLTVGSGFIFVRDVYKRRNGVEIGSFLHRGITQWSIRRTSCSRTFIHWADWGPSKMELDFHYRGTTCECFVKRNDPKLNSCRLWLWD